MKTLITLLAIACPLFAQDILRPEWVQQTAQGTITTAGTGTNCTIQASCVWIVAPASAASAQVVISGSFIAQVQFEASLDGRFWSTIPTQDGSTFTNSIGTYVFGLPFSFNVTYLRLRASTLNTGKVNVSIVTNPKSITGIGGGSSGAGANFSVLSGSSSITPGAVGDGATTSVGTVSVPGAAVGDPVQIAVSPSLGTGLLATGTVNSPSLVTVYITNYSGSIVVLGAGTYTASTITFTGTGTVGVIAGSATLTSGLLCDLCLASPGTIFVAGASPGELVQVSAPSLALGVQTAGIVSAANTVTVYLINATGSGVIPGSILYTAKVVH